MRLHTFTTVQHLHISLSIIIIVLVNKHVPQIWAWRAVMYCGDGSGRVTNFPAPLLNLSMENLFEAIKDGDLEEVKRIIVKDGVDPAAANKVYYLAVAS